MSWATTFAKAPSVAFWRVAVTMGESDMAAGILPLFFFFLK